MKRNKTDVVGKSRKEDPVDKKIIEIFESRIKGSVSGNKKKTSPKAKKK